MERPQREARKQENLTAEKHGGRVTPASGSGGTIKNDVRNEHWSIEVKSTNQKSYSLNREVLGKANYNALCDGRRMALIVAFIGPGLAPATLGRFVVTEEDDWLEREQELERLREENTKLWAKIEADC